MEAVSTLIVACSVAIVAAALLIAVLKDDPIEVEYKDCKLCIGNVG